MPRPRITDTTRSDREDCVTSGARAYCEEKTGLNGYASPTTGVIMASASKPTIWLAPLQGIGPDQLTLDALEARVRAGNVRELIMATNPNLEGDGTALLVANRLADTGVPITRLARGLASGSALEFANKEMLADALSGRQRF